MLAVGSTGVVSVASHLVGDLLQQMIQAFFAGKPQAATKIHLKLLPLFKNLFATTNPIPIKAALRLQGWAVGHTKLPLCDTPATFESDLKQALLDLALL
jgi:4-hydroxy-tetrahydrodipicolinate synthase